MPKKMWVLNTILVLTLGFTNVQASSSEVPTPITEQETNVNIANEVEFENEPLDSADGSEEEPIVLDEEVDDPDDDGSLTPSGASDSDDEPGYPEGGDPNEVGEEPGPDGGQLGISAPPEDGHYYTSASKPGKWIKASNGKWWYKHVDGTYTVKRHFINASDDAAATK